MTKQRNVEPIPDRDMTPAEYLNAAKQALQIKSDYALAKRLNIDNGYLSNIRKGICAVPNIIATKIAITLNIDPMTVIADIEAQRAKDPKKAEFWRSFLSRAG